MTDHIGKWLKVSGILGNIHAVAYVTSTEWGQIAEELKKPDYEATVVPTNRNFRALKVAYNLQLRNAGTEDQGVVNEMNTIELGEVNARIFRWRRDNLQTGKIQPVPLTSILTNLIS